MPYPIAGPGLLGYKWPAYRAFRPAPNYTSSPAHSVRPVSYNSHAFYLVSYNSRIRNFISRRAQLQLEAQQSCFETFTSSFTLYYDGDHHYGPGRPLSRDITPTSNSTSLPFGMCSYVLPTLRVLKFPSVSGKVSGHLGATSHIGCVQEMNLS